MRICPPVQIELKWHSLWENAVRAKQKLPEACRVFPASSPVALTTLPTTALPYLAIWSMLATKTSFTMGTQQIHPSCKSTPTVGQRHTVSSSLLSLAV